MICAIIIKDQDGEVLVYSGLVVNLEQKVEASFRKLTKSDIGCSVEGVIFSNENVAEKTIELLKRIELKNFQTQQNNYIITSINELLD